MFAKRNERDFVMINRKKKTSQVESSTSKKKREFKSTSERGKSDGLKSSGKSATHYNELAGRGSGMLGGSGRCWGRLRTVIDVSAFNVGEKTGAQWREVHRSFRRNVNKANSN